MADLDRRRRARCSTDRDPLGEDLVDKIAFHARFVLPLRAPIQVANSYEFEDIHANGVHTLRWTYSTSTAGGSNTLVFNVVEDLFHVYPDYMPTVLWNFFEPYSLP